MFSKLFKTIFVITSYSPILVIWWIVGIFTYIGADGKTLIRGFSEIKLPHLLINYWLLIIFILLFLLSWFLMYLAHKKLTKNHIEVKAIKSSDFNMSSFIISYFLPCTEFYKKDIIFIIAWIIIIFIIIVINKNSYFYNPLLKIFGYRYYEITTKKDVSFIMISRKKLINSKDINSYTQLADYVILNTN